MFRGLGRKKNAAPEIKQGGGFFNRDSNQRRSKGSPAEVEDDESTSQRSGRLSTGRSKSKGQDDDSSSYASSMTSRSRLQQQQESSYQHGDSGPNRIEEEDEDPRAGMSAEEKFMSYYKQKQSQADVSDGQIDSSKNGSSQKKADAAAMNPYYQGYDEDDNYDPYSSGDHLAMAAAAEREEESKREEEERKKKEAEENLKKEQEDADAAGNSGMTAEEQRRAKARQAVEDRKRKAREAVEARKAKARQATQGKPQDTEMDVDAESKRLDEERRQQLEEASKKADEARLEKQKLMEEAEAARKAQEEKESVQQKDAEEERMAALQREEEELNRQQEELRQEELRLEQEMKKAVEKARQEEEFRKMEEEEQKLNEEMARLEAEAQKAREESENAEEEARRIAEEKEAEAKAAEEKAKLEEEKLIADAHAAAAQAEEEARLAAQAEEEARLAAQAEEEARLAAQAEEDARLAAQAEEEARLEEERVKAEEARIAAEALAKEQTEKYEEARRAIEAFAAQQNTSQNLEKASGSQEEDERVANSNEGEEIEPSESDLSALLGGDDSAMLDSAHDSPTPSHSKSKGSLRNSLSNLFSGGKVKSPEKKKKEAASLRAYKPNPAAPKTAAPTSAAPKAKAIAPAASGAPNPVAKPSPKPPQAPKPKATPAPSPKIAPATKRSPAPQESLPPPAQHDPKPTKKTAMIVETPEGTPVSTRAAHDPVVVSAGSKTASGTPGQGTHRKTKAYPQSPARSVDSTGSIASIERIPRSPYMKHSGEEDFDPVCQNEYYPSLHVTKQPCQVCVFRLDERDRARFEMNGRSLLVNTTAGGCIDCQAFPSHEGEDPIRICRKCFFDTHLQAKRKEEAFAGVGALAGAAALPRKNGRPSL